MIFVSVFSPTVCEDGRIFCVVVLENNNRNNVKGISKVREYMRVGIRE